jgi:hypothetical protein
MSCVGITLRCGHYCPRNRIHFLSFPIGHSFSEAASGIVNHWMNSCLTLAEVMSHIAMNKVVNVAPPSPSATIITR